VADGSRETYFHFLLGYLLPLVHAQTVQRFSEFLVLDCGPIMTPILEETLRRLDFKFRIVPIKEIQKKIYLEQWDRWDRPWKSLAAVRMTAALVSQAWKDYQCPGTECQTSENLLIKRSPPPDYYLSENSEGKGWGYGTSLRSITNWQEISISLSQHGIEHTIYEPGAHCLGCQIAAFSSAKKIVGVRGAEWANAIWCQPNARARVMVRESTAQKLYAYFNQRGFNHPHVNAAMKCDPNTKMVLAAHLSALLDRLNINFEIKRVYQQHVRYNPFELIRFLGAR